MTTVIEFRPRRSATDAAIARATETLLIASRREPDRTGAEIILMSLAKRAVATRRPRPRKTLKRRFAQEASVLAPA